MDERKAILILDDEPLIGAIVRRAVGKDYDAEVYEDHEPALEAVARRDFWLAFVDLKLARADGLEVIRQMRSIRAGFVAVLMSGFLDPAIRARAADHTLAFLQKPFHIAAIRQILEERKASLREIQPAS